MRKIEIQRQKRLLDDFFKVDEVVLRHELASGRMSPPMRRLNLERGNGVAALLLDRQARTVVLVRQFRYPTAIAGPGWILEVVAGVCETGESLEATMRREILEETGYQVDALEPIASFYLSPGGSSEQIFLYCGEVSAANRPQPGGGVPQEGEDIEVVELPLEAAWKALDAGEIIDAKTMVALMWLRRREDQP